MSSPRLIPHHVSLPSSLHHSGLPLLLAASLFIYFFFLLSQMLYPLPSVFHTSWPRPLRCLLLTPLAYVSVSHRLHAGTEFPKIPHGVISPHMHVGLRVCTNALSLFIPSLSFFLCVFVGEEVCKQGMLACQIWSYRLFTISPRIATLIPVSLAGSWPPINPTPPLCVCPGKYMCAWEYI